MTTPQILMAVIIAANIIAICAEKNPQKSFTLAASVFIMQGIIYWGGFWE